MKSWIFRSKEDPGGWIEQESAALPGEPARVKVTHSGLNYKDALSVTRTAPISKQFPMVPGIDVVGIVIEDASGQFEPGQTVIATGYGLGERHWGAFSEEARLRPEWMLPLPQNLSSSQAAGFGTSGLTAALSIDALERYGIRPDQGPVIVSGATGGVGGYAVWLLAQSGYAVTAITGKNHEAGYLRSLGAREVLERSQFEAEPRPLGKEIWRAGIDVAGGSILANILPGISYGGAVAACGLASSMSLNTTVAPFILRGVALLGVDSVMASRAARQRAWDRLARAAASFPFEDVVRSHHFLEVSDLAKEMIASKIKGKILLHW